MPSTRHNLTDPESSPERNLSSTKLAGINIGLNIVCRVAQARKIPERRAMIWCVNYAKFKGFTSDELSLELNLDKAEIRTALTDPDADLTRFMDAVQRARKAFESSLETPVETQVSRDVAEAFDLAGKFHKRSGRSICEVVYRTRMGKSEAGFHHYLLNMDRAVFLSCPSDDSDRLFIFDLARSLSIGVGGGKKPVQLVPQIRACFGEGLIELLVLDEAHFIWPSDAKVKPKRLEFLRALYCMFVPSQVGIVLLATPQHALRLGQFLNHCEKSDLGQWIGRMIPYHGEETLEDKEVREVARRHAPGANEAVLDALVNFAQASAGYMGAMVNVIKLAEHKCGSEKLTAKAVLEAIERMNRKPAK